MIGGDRLGLECALRQLRRHLHTGEPHATSKLPRDERLTWALLALCVWLQLDLCRARQVYLLFGLKLWRSPIFDPGPGKRNDALIVQRLGLDGIEPG